MKDYEMTNEKTNQWVRPLFEKWYLQVLKGHPNNLLKNSDGTYTYSATAYMAFEAGADLARADLEAENERLKKITLSKRITDKAYELLVKENAALKAEVESLQTKLNEKRTSLMLALQEVDALEADALRYRYLFSDVNLQTIKDAVEQGIPLPSTNAELIEQIIGFYNTKEQADQLIDTAMKRGEA
jgi:hypothetical protein